MKTQKLQLKNGMTVLLTESHKSPVVSIQMWVRTGSADEKKGEEGISHFIEHLVFKGTRKFKVGEIASTIEGSGGELNAYTSFDQTVFYVTISKQFTDIGLTAISEMMGFPSFDQNEIDNEREVVIEEIKRGRDSLGRRSSQLMFSTAFKKHSYGIPVIGFDDNIRKVSRKTLLNYFQSRYVPRNMFLVVCGDFESSDMKSKVRHIFEEFEDFKVKPVKRNKEEKQNQTRVAVEKATFEQSAGYLAWKIPGVLHKDTPAIEMLSMVLGHGDSSRLVQKLRIEKAVSNSIGASSFAPEDEGVFAVSFGYQKENLEEILTGVNATIAELFKNPPTDEEISRALVSLESDKFYSIETVDGIARSIGGQWFSARSLKFQDDYLKACRQMTSEQLLKTAKKYLVPKTMSVVMVSNEEEKDVKKAAKKFVAEFKSVSSKFKIKARNVKSKSAKIRMPAKYNGTKTQRIVLNNGVTVLLKPLADTQVTSVKCAFLGGIRAESAEKNGVTDLLSRIWTSGTQNRNELEILNQTEALACSINPVAGRNSIGLGMEFISSFQEKASDLYFDCLTRPVFPESVLVREREMQIREIKVKKDSPSSLVSHDFMSKIFKGHPYAAELSGSEGTVSMLKRADVTDYWKSIANRKNLTITVCGSFNESFWLKKIEEATKELPAGARFSETYKVEKSKGQERTFTALKKEQSHVIYGFAGLTLTDPERYSLQVMQSILAGQGGRLFLELRDKASLAYSVSPIRMEGIEAGYFGAYIGCSPEKVQKSIEMMKEQFDRLIDETVSDEELLRAQRYLVGRHDIDLQRTGAIAASILYDDIYGIDYNESFAAAEKYFAVKKEKVREIAKRILSQEPVISVVGPNNPWN